MSRLEAFLAYQNSRSLYGAEVGCLAILALVICSRDLSRCFVAVRPIVGQGLRPELSVNWGYIFVGNMRMSFR